MAGRRRPLAVTRRHRTGPAHPDTALPVGTTSSSWCPDRHRHPASAKAATFPPATPPDRDDHPTDKPSLRRPHRRDAAAASPAGTDRAAHGQPDQAHRLFTVSLALSAARCLLTYIVLPVLVPLVGPTTRRPPRHRNPSLHPVALVFDVRPVRRFWLAQHPGAGSSPPYSAWSPS